MKIVSIVGARPQFIKAAPLSEELRKTHTEILVHTGQHYDDNMSAVFFEELQIPEPDYNLGVGSGPHGRQTGQMLEEIEDVLIAEQPDWVLVYGDTNSTLAGALAAVKLHIPLAHVEAGLRSYNRAMPEEHNRVLTDHCADLLLCPTETAVANLRKEGIIEGVHNVGDVMYDAVLRFATLADRKATILGDLNLAPGQYLLATVHRPANTDDAHRLGQIMSALAALKEPVIFPTHPRTRQALEASGLAERIQGSCVQMIEPVSYLEMLQLEQNARLILTDSGGVQKEAFFFAVPCVTLRSETEWVETVEAGWNVLAGVDREAMVDAVLRRQWPQEARPSPFGKGQASKTIANLLNGRNKLRKARRD